MRKAAGKRDQLQAGLNNNHRNAMPEELQFGVFVTRI